MATPAIPSPTDLENVFEPLSLGSASRPHLNDLPSEEPSLQSSGYPHRSRKMAKLVPGLNDLSSFLPVPRDFSIALLSRLASCTGLLNDRHKYGARVQLFTWRHGEDRNCNTRLLSYRGDCHRYLLEGQRPRSSACFLPRGSGKLSATAEWSLLR